MPRIVLVFLLLQAAHGSDTLLAGPFDRAGVAARPEESPVGGGNRVCRYAERQSKGMIMDLCRKMETDPGLRRAWTRAHEASNRKTLLAVATGAGSFILTTMGWANAMYNLGDCFEASLGFGDETCGRKPVGAFLVSGALLGMASIVTLVAPNTDRERALALSRGR